MNKISVYQLSPCAGGGMGSTDRTPAPNIRTIGASLTTWSKGPGSLPGAPFTDFLNTKAPSILQRCASVTKVSGREPVSLNNSSGSKGAGLRAGSLLSPKINGAYMNRSENKRLRTLLNG